MSRVVIILGIRGIPAAHGGFETFAEKLAIWLRDRGWQVIVYCQGSESGRREEDVWEGIRRIHIPIKRDGAIGTIEFDIKSTADALKQDGKILTLGYNTGFLSIWLRMRGRYHIVNMDGLEWKRKKYTAGPRAFLWMNERMAAISANVLIADHPEVAEHLATRAPREKTVIIPYGGDRLENVSAAPLANLQLESKRFFTLIARPEPENSVLEIVEAFSQRHRGAKLALLGEYKRTVPYQAAVLDAAGPEVLMLGAIYDRATVEALRFHSIAYLHGHQVGGTNPSLVEALGAGNPIIAHDNRFNRWVGGAAGLYFDSKNQISDHIDTIANNPALRDKLSNAAIDRWKKEFSWGDILSKYEEVILSGPKKNWHYSQRVQSTPLG